MCLIILHHNKPLTHPFVMGFLSFEAANINYSFQMTKQIADFQLVPVPDGHFFVHPTFRVMQL